MSIVKELSGLLEDYHDTHMLYFDGCDNCPKKQVEKGDRWTPDWAECTAEAWYKCPVVCALVRTIAQECDA